MSLKLVTAPTVEPVSLIEAKTHLRVLHDDDDTQIASLITAARQMVESGESWSLERSLVTTTWRLRLDRFPKCIELPRPPLIAVTSITYRDTAGSTQTLSPSLYTVSTDMEPARIVPTYGNVWPNVQGHVDDVSVTFTAGYGPTAADVPQAIKQAILLGVSDLYENRNETITGTIVNRMGAIRALLNGYQWSYR